MDFTGHKGTAIGYPAWMEKEQLVPTKEQLEQKKEGVWWIQGDLCQIVHIALAPEQKIQAEPGTMCYMSDEVKAETKMVSLGRMLTTGDVTKLLFRNKSKGPGYVGLTPNFPATIIPVNLDTRGGQILCKHDAFMGAIDPNTVVSWERLRPANALGCCCSGLPFTLQSIKAAGWVFLAAHGTVVMKTLKADEKLVVDTNAVVAFTQGVKVGAEKTGGCFTCCFSGEGMFNTQLTGPGTVWLCSMPMEKLRKLFARPPPKNKKQQAKATTQEN